MPPANTARVPCAMPLQLDERPLIRSLTVPGSADRAVSSPSRRRGSTLGRCHQRAVVAKRPSGGHGIKSPEGTAAAGCDCPKAPASSAGRRRSELHQAAQDGDEPDSKAYSQQGRWSQRRSALSWCSTRRPRRQLGKRGASRAPAASIVSGAREARGSQCCFSVKPPPPP
jgi:hypothetical protein